MMIWIFRGSIPVSVLGSRFNRAEASIIAFSLAVLATMNSVWAEEPIMTTKRPNVLFIIVDDQSPLKLKFDNSKSILDTPNIDSIAKQGMVIDGAYQMGSFSGAV